MDLVLTIVFFICAAIAVAGGLAVALTSESRLRLLGLVALAVGAAGAIASLSQVIAALVTLLCLLGATFLVADPSRDAASSGERSRWLAPTRVGLAGAVVAAFLLAALAVAAIGLRPPAAQVPNALAPADLGRLLFDRDAPALAAVGASLLVALALGAAAGSRRS